MKYVTWFVILNVLIPQIGYGKTIEELSDAELLEMTHSKKVDEAYQKFGVERENDQMIEVHRTLLDDHVKGLVKCQESEHSLRITNEHLINANNSLTKNYDDVRSNQTSDHSLTWFVIGILAGGAGAYFYMRK